MVLYSSSASFPSRVVPLPCSTRIGFQPIKRMKGIRCPCCIMRRYITPSTPLVKVSWTPLRGHKPIGRWPLLRGIQGKTLGGAWRNEHVCAGVRTVQVFSSLKPVNKAFPFSSLGVLFYMGHRQSHKTFNIVSIFFMKLSIVSPNHMSFSYVIGYMKHEGKSVYPSIAPPSLHTIQSAYTFQPQRHWPTGERLYSLPLATALGWACTQVGEHHMNKVMDQKVEQPLGNVSGAQGGHNRARSILVWWDMDTGTPA